MSKLRTQKKRSEYNILTSRQLLFQYALSIILYLAAWVVLFILATNLYYYYRWLTGDDFSIVFWCAQIIRETLPVWIFLICTVGWVFLTRHFIGKPLSYLDEIVAAAESIVTPSDTPVILSPALRNIQNNLNLIRAQALRNAMLAKESEQRKNDLIVYLAHDLKTPLTSIIGYLTLLRDEPEISAEQRARYTDISLDKALRLEDLINEFFDITRFNLTSLTLECERINLSRMLEQVSSEFLPILSEKNLFWSLAIQPDVEIYCDPDKLARVFDNLIRNAVNYSYPGTEISLSMETKTDTICIIVHNHGKTIPPDKLERIFEQFFRLDSSRSTATGGAGLGLAIAKEIAELHGGTITAASEHENITFTVNLPVRNL